MEEECKGQFGANTTFIEFGKIGETEKDGIALTEMV